MTPKPGVSERIVLDAGPLIAVYSRRDIAHRECLGGYAELATSGAELIVPILVVAEVNSWVGKRERPELAQAVLENLYAAATLSLLSQADLEVLVQMVRDMPDWSGSLADASVVLTAHQCHCPVWTLDYRDLGRFKALEFWTPTAKASTD